jgi:hypothetical protein
LATKTARAVGAGGGAKAACHSDLADAASAEQLQQQKLVQLRSKPAVNSGTEL